MPGIYDRKMFQMQGGGMMPPMQGGGMMPPMQEAPIDQMTFISPDQEAQIYQEAQNLPPEVLQMVDQERMGRQCGY